MRTPLATPWAGSFSLPSSSSRFSILFRCSAQIFHPQQKVILSAFPCRFSSSIHPSILSTASSSLSQRCFTRIPRLCQVPVSSSSYSPILDRLSIHPRLLVFIHPSFCSLGEYVSRPLLRENFISAFLWVCYDLPAIEYAAMPLLQKKPLIDFVYALSVFEPR